MRKGIVAMMPFFVIGIVSLFLLVCSITADIQLYLGYEVPVLSSIGSWFKSFDPFGFLFEIVFAVLTFIGFKLGWD